MSFWAWLRDHFSWPWLLVTLAALFALYQSVYYVVSRVVTNHKTIWFYGVALPYFNASTSAAVLLAFGTGILAYAALRQSWLIGRQVNAARDLEGATREQNEVLRASLRFSQEQAVEEAKRRVAETDRLERIRSSVPLMYSLVQCFNLEYLNSVLTEKIKPFFPGASPAPRVPTNAEMADLIQTCGAIAASSKIAVDPALFRPRPAPIPQEVLSETWVYYLSLRQGLMSAMTEFEQRIMSVDLGGGSRGSLREAGDLYRDLRSRLARAEPVGPEEVRQRFNRLVEVYQEMRKELGIDLATGADSVPAFLRSLLDVDSKNPPPPP